MVKELINPCLWFDGNAKEAAEFYSSVFMDTKIVTETSMVVTFESAGLMFTCLNGGSHFKFNPSISFFVLCETEEEVDFAWNQLVNEGTVLMPLDQYDWSKKYGWVKDRYGVTWQLSFGKMQEVGQKITPCFMFVGEQYGRAEEALNFYSSIFKESAIDGILRYGNNEFPDKEGAVKHAQFSLSGQNLWLWKATMITNFHSMKPFLSSSIVKLRKKLIIIGTGLPTEDRKANMAG